MSLEIAYSFLSFFFRENKKSIRAIYLFGSFARGDYSNESDIDLFIDTEEDIRKAIERSLKKFYELEWGKWQNKGYSNKLSVKYGRLSEWELKHSIEKEGKILYGESKVGEKYFLFNMKPIQEKRMNAVRELFGRKEKHFKDEGAVIKHGGKVYSKRTFIIPAGKLQHILKILSEHNIIYEMEEIWM